MIEDVKGNCFRARDIFVRYFCLSIVSILHVDELFTKGKLFSKFSKFLSFDY